MNNRSKAIEELAELILAVQREHPVRVALDGVDAAGKTTLADELALPIEARCRPVIRASIDGFHNPKEIRYRQGADSARGYYQDSFNNQAIIEKLLNPLGPEGNKEYVRMVYDYRVDAANHEPPREAPSDGILIFDGVFLLRPELISYWDFRIFVEAGFAVSVPRAVQRDLSDGFANSEEAIIARYHQRYVAGQRLYFEDAHPKAHADVIFDNNNFDFPTMELRKRNNCESAQ
ncbi:MAG: hypothetical protein ISR58_03855 [Anaerolineales bacterium]|nr:hypothetical protein [Chloroflexota bacterium]MBL6980306.1 hypothetical protein [Anaerolineales bacterium]